MQRTSVAKCESFTNDSLITDDGSITAEAVEALLAQNTAMREALYEAARSHPSETMRQRLLLQACGNAPVIEVARMRARVLQELRFPRHLRKMWSASEVEEWLENEAIRLAGGGVEADNDTSSETSRKDQSAEIVTKNANNSIARGCYD